MLLVGQASLPVSITTVGQASLPVIAIAGRDARATERGVAHATKAGVACATSMSGIVRPVGRLAAGYPARHVLCLAVCTQAGLEYTLRVFTLILASSGVDLCCLPRNS